MDEEDRAELEWWRHFAAKLEPGSMIRPGSALLGYRLVLRYQAEDGSLKQLPRLMRRLREVS